MGAPRPAPGWYPDPSGAPGQRYWDGIAWTDVRIAPPQPPNPPGMSTTQKWWLIGGVAAAVIVLSTLVGVQTYLDSRPVRSAHSDDPSIEAFYRELDSNGLGEMKVKDAVDRAKEACHGNGLVLWGKGDYSMADSFRFATAALGACDALGA
jgi:uncharacterized protein DUF2510